MDRTFTLKELVEVVAEALCSADREAEADLLMRRVRYWTLAGALPTAGARHAGSGRHRRYPIDSVYLAMILHYLADWGSPIGVIRLVSETILERKAQEEDSAYWAAAVTGTQMIHLCIVVRSASDRPDRNPHPHGLSNGIILAFFSEDEMAAFHKLMAHVMSLNLTKIFRGIILEE
jgi:hypothetical protein